MTIATQATGKQWTVASETRPNVLYVVKNVGGYYSCDCPGHYQHGHCKHADAVKTSRPRTFRVDPALGLSVLLAPAK